MLRSTIIPTLLIMLIAATSQAGTWSRSWLDHPPVTSTEAIVRAETLTINQGRLSPNQDFPFFNVKLRFHPAEGSKLPSLLPGESEDLHAFIVVASEEEEGTEYFGLRLLLLTPTKESSPFEWVPRGFHKRNSRIPDEDLRVHLKRMGLVPVDQDVDLWIFYHDLPHTKMSLTTLHQQHVDAPETNAFPVNLDCVTVRDRRYRIPATIDPSSMMVSISRDNVLHLTWNDPAMETLSSGASERIRYRFTIERRLGSSSAHVWRSAGEGTVPARPGVSTQGLTIPPRHVALAAPFERNSHYRISVMTERASYGNLPVQPVQRSFVFVPGLAEEDGIFGDGDVDDDPFSSLRRIGH